MQDFISSWRRTRLEPLYPPIPTLQVNPGTPVYLWSAPIPFAGLNAEQILTNFPATNKIAGAMVAKTAAAQSPSY